MRGVSIIGLGITPFGKHRKRTIIDLAQEACREAIEKAGVEKNKIQALYLGNYASEALVSQGSLAAIVGRNLGLDQIPCIRVGGACASSGIALRQAFLSLAYGIHDFVLVVGVEQMSTCSTGEAVSVLAAAADKTLDGAYGLTFPGLFALIMRRHMEEYGTTRDQVSCVAVKNHHNGFTNPITYLKDEITVREVNESRLIADPLTMYDCCPINDGAAAVVLCPSDLARDLSVRPVKIVGSGHATGTTSVQQMESFTTFPATIKAADEAYKMAGVGPEDIDVVELHDCFTIAEIVDSEDLGLFEKGEGGAAVEAGQTAANGKIPINPSGGLMSRGHPAGATGLAQVYELVLQLRGEAVNQVNEPELGLAHIVGGPGAVCTVHILARDF
jgi:acetyl-CoA C-acetyltransferase